MAELIPIHPENMSAPFGVWTTAIAVTNASRMIFVSGLTARDASGAVVGAGNMAAQTRQVCANLAKVLETAGGTLSDVASLTVYVTDIAQFEAIHKERRSWFKNMPPASAMVEVSRLVDPNCLIEISAVAAL